MNSFVASGRLASAFHEHDDTPTTTESTSPTVPDPTSQPTMSIDEVAELLGVCRSTMYRAVKDGEIPVIKIGRRYLVPTAHVAHLLGIEETTAR